MEIPRYDGRISGDRLGANLKLKNFLHLLDIIRRFRQGRYPEGNTQNYAYSRGRPVADNVDTERKILFWYVGFSQAQRLVIVHNDEEMLRNGTYPKGV